LLHWIYFFLKFHLLLLLNWFVFLLFPSIIIFIILIVLLFLLFKWGWWKSFVIINYNFINWNFLLLLWLVLFVYNYFCDITFVLCNWLVMVNRFWRMGGRMGSISILSSFFFFRHISWISNFLFFNQLRLVYFLMLLLLLNWLLLSQLGLWSSLCQL